MSFSTADGEGKEGKEGKALGSLGNVTCDMCDAGGRRAQRGKATRLGCRVIASAVAIVRAFFAMVFVDVFAQPRVRSVFQEIQPVSQ